MRRLGIDHGGRRVGLAVSDESGRIALPRDTWSRKDPDALLDRLAHLVAEETVEEIVVGLPLTLEGREGASARRARRFAERLEARAGVPVVLWDERLTSAAAERALREGGVRAREQRGKVDTIAATLLLQSYLDSRPEEERWDGRRPDGEPGGGRGPDESSPER